MMLSVNKKQFEEDKQQDIKVLKNSKAFERVSKVGIGLYILIIALIVTINIPKGINEMNEITNIIFILSPLLFTIFLKDFYNFLVAREEYRNISRSKKDAEYEDRSLTAILSAMATAPVIIYLIFITFKEINLCIFAIVILTLGIFALIAYHVYPCIKFPKNNTDDGNEQEQNTPPSS